MDFHPRVDWTAIFYRDETTKDHVIQWSRIDLSFGHDIKKCMEREKRKLSNHFCQLSPPAVIDQSSAKVKSRRDQKLKKFGGEESRFLAGRQFYVFLL